LPVQEVEGATGRTWGAVVDGSVVTVSGHEAVMAGEVAAIPLLIGATRDEVQLFQVLNGERFRPADEAALLAEMGRAGAADPARLLDA
jgi:para-nitrobenzyl esterase